MLVVCRMFKRFDKLPENIKLVKGVGRVAQVDVDADVTGCVNRDGLS